MKKRIKISRKFTFCASHFIPNHPGKCKNLHGHDWTIEIAFLSWVDSLSGEYGIDFGEIKKLTVPLLEKLDHNHLNDLIAYPSAEAIAMYIWEHFAVNNTAQLLQIKVWESPDSCVTYEGGIL